MSRRSTNPFRKLRGLTDRELTFGLTHHTQVLRGMSIYVTRMWRWQWGFVVLHLAEIAAIIWLSGVGR